MEYFVLSPEGSIFKISDKLTYNSVILSTETCIEKIYYSEAWTIASYDLRFVSKNRYPFQYIFKFSLKLEDLNKFPYIKIRYTDYVHSVGVRYISKIIKDVFY